MIRKRENEIFISLILIKQKKKFIKIFNMGCSYNYTYGYPVPTSGVIHKSYTYKANLIKTKV